MDPVEKVNLHADTGEFTLPEYQAIYNQKVKGDPVAVDWHEFADQCAVPWTGMSTEQKIAHLAFLERALKAIKITRKSVFDGYQKDLSEADEAERERYRAMDKARRLAPKPPKEATPAKARPRPASGGGKPLSNEDRIQRLIDSQMALFGMTRDEAEKFVRGKIEATKQEVK